jgi:hypothetical protein
MNTFRSHLLRKVFICVASVLCCSFLSGNAGAQIYDDFNDGVISSSKWALATGSGLFTEHDGKLYFDGSSPDSQRLSAAPLFSDNVRLGMEFYDFSSTNNSVSGVLQSSALQLTLGRSTNHVSVMIGSNMMGDFLEFNHFVDGSRVDHISFLTNITTGKLGLYYDGSLVYAAYSDQVGQDAPWYTFNYSINPGWTTPVGFSVSGVTGGSGMTSFQIDNIGYSVSDPYTLVLLIPGLAGLLVARRKLNK